MAEEIRTVRGTLKGEPDLHLTEGGMERVLSILGRNSMEELGGEEKIDALELVLCDHPGACDLPLEHRFTPGLYIRTIRAKPGVLATTYIHKTEHPFVVTRGVVSVWDGERIVRVSAPYLGVTRAGTRRVVYVHEDAEWTTFHPTDLTDVDEIEREIFDFRTLPDGSNVRDRFRVALEAKGEKEIEA